MERTYEKYPFWRTRPEDVTAAVQKVKLGKTSVLTKSAGGRDIYLVAYGEKQDYKRRANYSSACGAGDTRYYADREGKAPTILLFGATHGQEMESIMALLNLISLIETGRDLRGAEVPSLTEAYQASHCRLLIIPIFNIDGRSRCPHDSFLGEPKPTLQYFGTGTWKDGTLCGWPGCKTVHPMKGEMIGHMGSYYNDNGINFMHDNFFSPMADETRALLALADEEAPECIISLHGGSNTTNSLLQPAYTPVQIREGVHRLAAAAAARAEAQGLPAYVAPVKGLEGFPPASFNLTSALHHVCGAVAATYESNEGLAQENAFTAEQILLHHYCLFESLFRCDWREK